MPKVETLRSLIDRLEAGTGADRELDARIYYNLALTKTSPYALSEDDWVRHFQSGVPLNDGEPPPLTGSIDASLALVELLLPGWFLHLDYAGDREAEHRWRCTVGNETPYTRAPTAPRAILIALMRALLAKETAHA
jgi:hypothetical protein